MYFFSWLFPFPFGKSVAFLALCSLPHLTVQYLGSICFFTLWKYSHFPGLTEDFPSLPFCTIFSCFGEFDRVFKGKQLHLTIFYQK